MVSQERVILPHRGERQEKLHRPGSASVIEKGEAFFERMFLWVLVSEVIGKSGDVYVLLRKESEL